MQIVVLISQGRPVIKSIGEGSIGQKKGEAFGFPFFIGISLQLERVAPIDHHIDPVAVGADSAIRRIAAIDLVAKPEVITGLADAVIDVTRVIPEDIGSNAHAWSDEVPQIPLSQENSVAVKLGDTSPDPRSSARNPRRPVTINVECSALEVRAEQNRAGRRGGTGQETFRAPNVRVTADQPAT